ncbi:hypothetical protein D3C84_1204920 [compost metagenome]
MRQRQAPKRLVLIEETQALFVEIVPEKSLQPFAPKALMGRRHRTFTALEPQVQA